MLVTNNIALEENNFRSSLQIEIVETDLESFSLDLYYGIYKLKVNILMTELNNNYFMNSSIISNGSYGSVYSVILLNRLYAIKKIIFRNENNLDEELEKVYKEYFLGCIASILKVGPKM